eukprot:TRINITY_DN26738_c0_g1_i1.p1 TRINITY_DN26738_c0_g1~~TRINITY_DN26738_c0_g1_i1.p1  ORF type:complete len:588 (+),score=84.28 TRINITY_DN26738_c0_g1_i1:101-1864(+)
MVWVSETPSAESSQHRIPLDGPARLADVAEWVDHVVTTESKRLGCLGRKVLPLKVTSCDLVPMRNTCDAQEACVFNRVNCATAFDFNKISSLEVGSIDQCLEETDGKTYFCAVCLLLVRRSVGEDVALLCPYVHCDAGNELKYWAFSNSRGEAQYLVRSNIRQGSAITSYPEHIAEPSEGPSAEPKTTPSYCRTCSNSSQAGPGIRKKGCTDKSSTTNEVQANDIRRKWAQLSWEQRAELLVVDDPDIVKQTLASLGFLFETSSKTSAQIFSVLEGLPLLAYLELGRKPAGQQILSISQTFVQDCNGFLTILEGLCCQLFSGTHRCRLARSEWSTLMAKASPDLLELQRQLAQLIEQQLWELADLPCDERDPTKRKRRPRRKKKASSRDASESQGSGCSSESPLSSRLQVEESPEFLSDASTSEQVHTNSQVETSVTDTPSPFVQPPGLEFDSLAKTLDTDSPSPLVQPPGLELDSLVDTSDTDSTSPFNQPPGLKIATNSLAETMVTDFPSPWIQPPGLDVETSSVVETSLTDSSSSFTQPPGLEIDDASLVRRLWERNQLLIRSLTEAGLKIPVLQLIQELWGPF